MFDILFAGTGASVPSRDRSLPCIAVKQGRSISLFDCGEASQKQLMLSTFSFMKIDRIFITHMHGDHILGLPGLLQTMGMSGRREPVRLFGPRGLKDSITKLMDACEGDLEFDLDITEADPGDSFDFETFDVLTFATEHNCPSIGYLYREKDGPGHLNKDKAVKLGLKPGPDFSRIQNGETVKGINPEQVIGKPIPGCSFAYPGDTLVCDSVKDAIEGVDVLIHESTYVDSDRTLAMEHYHSTAGDVAKIASDSDVRALFLIHISNRYGGADGASDEARQYFENTFVPEDLDVYRVTRDGAELIFRDLKSE